MLCVSKYSIQQVKEKVEYEGLGYCIQNYFSAKSIENQELSKLWATAASAMDKIERLLEKRT